MVAENCWVPPVVTDAEFGLIETATFAELELDAEELEDTPQPTRPKAWINKQAKPTAIQEYRCHLRNLVLFKASKPCRVSIILGYQDAIFEVLIQVSKVHVDRGHSTMQAHTGFPSVAFIPSC